MKYSSVIIPPKESSKMDKNKPPKKKPVRMLRKPARFAAGGQAGGRAADFFYLQFSRDIYSRGETI